MEMANKLNIKTQNTALALTPPLKLLPVPDLDASIRTVVEWKLVTAAVGRISSPPFKVMTFVVPPNHVILFANSGPEDRPLDISVCVVTARSDPVAVAAAPLIIPVYVALNDDAWSIMLDGIGAIVTLALEHAAVWSKKPMGSRS
ncbi:uncharacterized protein FRV6_11732 [Fusarium oxysporum]|uniref:Uncharacterized protein n=1 Tax=Fusarium oxysporum TaxID=5507 RepID=A0A2H3TIU6_FUSOX|nr:uncharacterized protein FRV6_11732 [Fusarium oxysporum]